ncbi:hypothetical protein A3D62_02410 [Candidatus Kaiserbacteria bacterium RIFCSPHIGHO2_02_FULL_49_11]|uniref:Uncharacterized protein n=1 Tax=Candidatus Kaiserbacteria bacterium RIFCSPHIGHO2_02_FULL_49_11 TaxID=1798489 RepID=A0A1F6D1E1_9BACT|nr:MAG: hypothetical protein A3D62_02410 [Candidatus Kaiserbacteria bacterium RIFCSPHIGHO2_02_FULL_49_11]
MHHSGEEIANPNLVVENIRVFDFRTPLTIVDHAVSPIFTGVGPPSFRRERGILVVTQEPARMKQPDPEALVGERAKDTFEHEFFSASKSGGICPHYTEKLLFEKNLLERKNIVRFENN